MTTTQTMWVLQWDRYTAIAKSQNASPEFWTEYRKIKIPSDGQITEFEIGKLKELMGTFKLDL